MIGIGTRYADFTSASKSAWQNPDVNFININIAELDAFKQSAIPLQGDAKQTIEILTKSLKGYNTGKSYVKKIKQLNTEWD